MTYAMSRLAKGRRTASAAMRIGLVFAVALGSMLLLQGASADTIDELDLLIPTATPTAQDFAGWAVSVSGDTAVVGAPLFDGAGTNEGRAMVYVRDATTGGWGLQAVLVGGFGGAGSPTSTGDRFGQDVAIDGDTIVVGAPREDTGPTNSGMVYVFTRVGTTWTQATTLQASNRGNNDRFGSSVDIEGGDLIVGAPNEDGASGPGNQGAAYVFTGSGTTWNQQGGPIRATAGPIRAGDNMGTSVGISGDRAIVGAPNWEPLTTGPQNQGRAIIFTRAAGTWTQQTYGEAGGGGATVSNNNDRYGEKVAIDGDRAIVGHPNHDNTAYDNIGRAVLLTWSAGFATYVFDQSFTGTGSNRNDRVGRGVHIDGDLAVVGANGRNRAFVIRDDNAITAGNGWVELSTILTPSEGNGSFGRCVAIDDSKVVVGANTTDVDFGSGEITNCGAAYAFGIMPCISNLGTGTQSVECDVTTTTNTQVIETFDVTSDARSTLTVSATVDGLAVAGAELVVTAGSLSAPTTGATSATITFTHEFSYNGTTPTAHAVELTVEDDCGLSPTVTSYTVTIQDTTAPVITLTGAAALDVECVSGSYTEQGATATDACDGTLTVTPAGDTVDVNTLGTYVVTYDVTDASGNAATQVTRTVTVKDTTAPAISLNGLASITLECGVDTYNEENAVVTDDCDTVLNGTLATVGGDTVDVNTLGTYVVTYDATDSSGNAATQMTRTVEVEDTTRPSTVTGGVSNFNVECTSPAGAPYTWNLTATDNCDPSPTIVTRLGSALFGPDVSSGHVFPLGDSAVWYFAQDSSGNTSNPTQVFNVTVVDTTAPVISLVGPPTITLECGTQVYNELGATVSDLCDTSPTLTIDNSAVMDAPGTYTVTYTATDSEMNVSTATRTVIVQDTLPPTITLTGAATILLECNVDTYTELGATVTDACESSLTATIDATAVDAATPGTYLVTYNATDSSLNAAVQVTRTVIVQDTTAPVITLTGPASITLECDVDTYTELGATVLDACDTALTTATVGGDPVDVNTLGTYVVTYDATDSSGNMATQVTRTVNVVDTTAPVITLNGVSPVTVECVTGTYTELGASAIDSCDPSVTVVIGGDVVNTAVPGTYTVTYNASDSSGNAANQVTRTVNVEDNTAPVITVTGATTVTLECGVDSYTELGATVFDACDAGVTAVIGGDTVDTATLGMYTVTYDATDSSGNMATQVSRTVTVVDTTAPVLTLVGAASLTLECGLDTYTEPGATVFDACDTGVAVVVTGTVDATMPGTYTVTYDATDTTGNVATQLTRTVIVQDTIAPVITLTGTNPQLLECGVDSYTELGSTVFDACDATVMVMIDSSAVNAAIPGSYAVTYDATDTTGNVATTVTRTVIVQDTTPPSITCPANVDDFECTSSAGAAVTFAAPTAVDACDMNPTITCSPASGSVFPLGISTVTCTATDSAGNSASCSFTVEVVDTTPPVITLVGATSITLECGVDSYIEQSATVSDNCDPAVTVVINSSSVDADTPGTYTVTYNATDNAGNNALEVTRTVVVEDTVAPVLTMIGAATVTLECSVDTYTEQSASVFDACDSMVSVVVGGDTVDVTTLGTYLVTYDATDSSGNSAIQLTRTVIVQDTIAPVITLTGANPQLLECSVDTYTELGATVSDACDAGVTVVIDATAVDVTTPGDYTVTYNATDSSGNDATEVTRTVTVQDTIAPVITLTGPATITLECSIDTYTELGATVFDACDKNVTVTIDNSAVDVTALGTYTVTYDATDSSGNVATQVTRTVIVVDTTPPAITSAITRSLLWPANNGMLSPGLTASSLDACDGSLTYTVTIYSDEANGTGIYSPDGQGTTNALLKLRSERAYPGNGRFYLIVVTSTDASGNTGFSCHSAVVPISPTTGSIVSVRGQATTAEGNCATNNGSPTGLNTIHTYTITVP